jgi:hypothetical protein
MQGLEVEAFYAESARETANSVWEELPLDELEKSMKQKNSASGFWRKSFSVQFSNSCLCNCVHHNHTFNSYA